ncbi:TonB-dependent receptor [Novosphingobium mangrovi (ex Huang et al. 2023)]|uniref:TonB-dependent receptor n=1 Tax=Novosphingobium mangrovi (ex Huang et al. 2023) TaxID=2976432 RepID=A0ABT2I8Q5_9SPHN|nr:TonB-dependent receptor [Novosphingobium mangrovi (ex Huang et al. 2023)]MCT2401200.1 TonB-dependent receptor [Novosphingobium mangrovi (ex Huang et al. 2023)]
MFRRTGSKFVGLQVTTSLMAILAATPAFAQAAGDDEGYGNAIIVTAQKREQSINDVGMAITALSGEALKNQQISSLEDIATTVPGLSFTTSASNAPVFTLRGVGFYDVTIGASPTVSVYVDQVSLPFSILTGQANFDVERVEVLKGPQGTLFGQNSTGGAINFVAAKPTSSFTAGGDLTYGRFSTFEANAYLSGPLSDTLKARVAGRIIKGDDWQRGYYANDLTNGSREVYTGRALFDFEPTDTVKFELALNAWNDRSDPIVPQVFGFQPQVDPDNLPASLSDYPVSPEDARAADYTPSHKPYSNNRFYQASLRGDIELGGGLTLTSLTSYLDFKLRQTQGGDGVAPRILDVYNQRGNVTSFSQELRISNDTSGLFRFTIGGNYDRSTADEISELDFSDNSSNEFFGILTGEYTTQQSMRTIAAFGDAEYDIADHLTAKAGIRYTNARRKYYTCYYDQGVDGAYPTGDFFNSLSSIFNPGLGPYEPGACFVLDNITSDGDPADYLGGPFSDTLKEDNVSWRAGLDFKPQQGTLIYANVAKGYKAGSYPAVSAAVQSEYLPVVQESVMAFEIGTKLTLFDKKAQLSAAAFYYDYKNKQLRTKIIDPVFGIVDALVNIPKSRSEGVELELSLWPVRGLSINGAFIYLDSKVKEYVGINAGGVEDDFAGALVPFSPKYQASVSADYDFPVSDRVDAFLGGSLKYRSKANSVVGFSEPTYEIPNYALIDLRAGIHSSDDTWRFQIWGKNITNKYYWTNVVASYETLTRYPGMPATYGATISYRY